MDRTDVRLLIASGVISTFLVLGVLAYAIINTNSRVDENIQTVEDGIVCMLGSIAGRDGINRPSSEDASESCRVFLRRTESSRK